ncbi:SulP family inorganic anion transporter, partial [Acidisoma sp. C75]
SPTQTAVAERAGARSQFAQLVFALTVCLVLVSLVGWLRYLPRAVLAAIIFTIALGLIDHRTLRAMRRESPGEWWLALVTAAAVAGLGVEDGMVISVVLSLLRHVRHSYRPHTALLRRAAMGGWQEEEATPGQQSAPGVLIYRFNADLFYANAERFAEEVRALVQAAPDPVHFLVIEAEAIPNVDYSAARTLARLLQDLRGQGVRVRFARVSASLRADLIRHHLMEEIGADQVFATRHDALRDLGGLAPRKPLKPLPDGPDAAG